MKAAIFVLVLLGGVGVVSAILGISSYSVTMQGTTIAHFHGTLSRWAASGWGVCLLLLAFGIYRRSMLAYWGGWVVLVVSCTWVLYLAVPVILASQPRPPAWLLAVSIVGVSSGCILVLTYWGRWWHRQLGHFQGNAG